MVKLTSGLCETISDAGFDSLLGQTNFIRNWLNYIT